MHQSINHTIVCVVVVVVCRSSSVKKKIQEINQKPRPWKKRFNTGLVPHTQTLKMKIIPTVNNDVDDDEPVEWTGIDKKMNFSEFMTQFIWIIKKTTMSGFHWNCHLLRLDMYLNQNE